MLLEREQEIEELTLALAQARRGHGSLLVISGQAGSGKTALLTVALERARRRRFVVCRARGSGLEQELSFGVIRQLFEPVLCSLAPVDRSRLLSGAAAATGGVFDEFATDPAAGTGDGFATLHGLYWLTSGLAAPAPLVVAVDDVQWADAPSLRTLSYLAGRISDLPVVMLVTLLPHERTRVRRACRCPCFSAGDPAPGALSSQPAGSCRVGSGSALGCQR